MPRPHLTELDRMLMGPLSLSGLDRIETEVNQGAILAEVFGSPFFARVKGQLRAIENDGASDYSNIFSILEIDDQRHNLARFLLLIKNKLEKGKWKHLCNRLTSDSANTSLKAIFEIMIVGNLLNQLPSAHIQLDAQTIGKKDCDIRVKLINRDVDIEVTMLDESEHAREWHKRLQRQKVTAGAVAHSVLDGTRVLAHIKGKSKDFLPHNPNVLVMQLFDWRERTKFAMDNLKSGKFSRVGLVMLFNRKMLAEDHIVAFDPECALTKKEVQKLIELLNGKDFIPLPFV